MGVWEEPLTKNPVNFRVLITALLLGVLLCPTVLFARRSVRVGVYQNPPKVFVDESGVPAGIFIDVLRHIAAAEDWELQFVEGSWAEGLERLASGQLDLMPDVAYTAERARNFSFHSVPVLSSWFQVYAHRGSRIQSILDLAGKKIAVLQGSVQQDTFAPMVKSFGLEVTLVAAPDYESVFTAVVRGEADAAIANQFYGNMNAKKLGLEDTAIIFNPSALHFASPLNHNRYLLDRIDEHMRLLKSDLNSVYYQSLKRWTQESVSYRLPDELKAVALIILASLLLSVAGSLILKRQVNARTKELQQSHRELETRVAERTAELAAAMKRAEESDRIKSAFLASMSHELRTPLNSIIGFTGILLQGLAGPMNDEQNKQLSMVQKSARHLLALINDVLDISKIEAGQLQLSIARFNLRPSLEKIMMMLAPMAAEKGIELRCQIAEDVGEVLSDQRRIEQIVLNLLNNALKFTEKGCVSLNCRVENGFCLIEVSDTGIGMQADKLREIFLPFHQLDSGLARKHEGTGLGLSICKKLLEMMGGTIDVTSQPGVGSSFFVSFPVSKGV